MSVVPSVVRELVQSPLPEIIKQLGLAIADAQRALDSNSVTTATEMATTEVKVGDESFNLISLGFTPAFYSFTEATVEAKLSFSMTETTEFKIGGEAKINYGVFAASINASYSRKFSVTAEGASSIAARLVSLPTPEQLDRVIRKLSEQPPIPASPI